MIVVDNKELREPYLLTPNKKPVGPVEVDFNNPLARGCVLMTIPGYKKDVSTNTFFPSLRGTHEYMQGSGVVVDATSRLTKGTFLAYFMFESGVANYNAVQWINPGATTVAFMYFSGNVRLTARGGGSLTVTTTTPADVGSYHHHAMTFDAYGAKACSYYHDGVHQQDFTWLDVSSLPDDSCLFGLAGNDKTPAKYVMLYDRTLSEEEIRSLQDNPYQILKPA